MNKIVLNLLLTVALLIVFSADGASEKQKVIAVGDRSYPPLEFVNAHGEPDGFNVEVFRAVAAQAGIDVEIRLVNWMEALRQVDEGYADLFIDLGYSQERARRYRFGDPHGDLRCVIVSRKKSGIFSEETLRGKTIILQPGEIANEHFKAMRLTENYISAPDAFSAFALLSRGKYDAFVCNQLAASHYMKLFDGELLEVHPLNMLPPITTAFAIDKKSGSSQLLHRLETAERAIHENGTYRNIYKKWFQKEQSKRSISFQWGWLGIIPVGGLCFWGMMRRRLKREKDREKDLLLSGLHIPVELLDARGLFVSANKAFLDLFDLNEIKRWKNCNEFMVCPLNCSHALDERCILTEVVKTRVPVKKFAVIRGRNFQITASPIFDSSGSILYMVKTYADISEQVERIEHTKVMNLCLETFFMEPDVMKAVERVGQSICEYMNAARMFIMRFDSEKYLADSYFEYVEDGSEPMFTIKDYPFDPREKWYRTFLEKGELWVEDATTPDAMAIFGTWADTFRKSKAKSLYVASIFVDGKLWGDFGIIYEERLQSPSELQQDVLKHAAHFFGELLERKSSQNKLLNALREARKADHAKSFFLASVSHELRTPLNSVIGFTDLLKKGEISPSDTREYLDCIDNSANSLLNLVNDVLDLSRLEVHHMTLKRDKTKFPELSQEIVNLFCKQAGKKGVAFQCRIPAMPPLELDAIRIRQILFNLIGNAVKFTHLGRVEFQAEFIAGTDGAGTLVFSVTDSGPGIPPEDIQKLTEPFVKLSRMRGTNASHNGTGLGLAVVRRLLAVMDGELLIESTPGRGSTFTVKIHQVQIAADIESRSAEIPLPVVPSRSVLPAVLIVDDVAMNLKVMSAICRKVGFRDIQTASSGAVALELLEKQSFSIILTDLWMPEMNGELLAKTIHADWRFNAIPVIAVTADMDARKTFDVNCFHSVMNKPVTIKKVEELIRSCLQFDANIALADNEP